MASRKQMSLAMGSHGDYQWLTATQHDLDTLLQLCPQALIGKFIAVTSLDSGPLVLSDDQVSAGWESRDNIAYSPRIETVDGLRHGECGGFDEWYVFNGPADLGQLSQGNVFEASLQPGLVAVFVNFGGFAFHTFERQDHLLDLFWAQLEWIRPESYIADGDVLNFVSCDKDLFIAVRQALGGAADS